MSGRRASNAIKLIGLACVVTAVALSIWQEESLHASRRGIEWLPVTKQSLEIAEGSPLDFSGLVGSRGGGALSILAGHFTSGGKPVTLNCASLAPGFSPTPGSGFPDHDVADRYAVQLRRHGYNLVRFHYIDALLMQDAKADFVVNNEQRDRFQYLLAALSRNGIRWLIDVASSPNAALGNIGPHRWSQNRGMIWRTFVEPAAYAHWRTWAKFLLTDPNPYTGRTLANDPGTVGLILVNEPSLMYRSFVAGGGARAPLLPGVATGYAAWQRTRLPGKDHLPAPVELGSSGAAMARFQAYLTDLQRTVTQNMVDDVRSSGYAGPTTSFDNWPMINQIPSRRDLDFIDMHGYAQSEMPSGVGGFEASSSILNGGRYLQQMAMARVFGRPMTISEHGDFFPNPNRFQTGLMVPAFAAIQGWDAVCQHADGPIDLAYDGKGVRKDAIYSDAVGLDPVRRVGETLTALMLLRHEVTPASGALSIIADEPTALRGRVTEGFGPEIGMLGWLVRLGIRGERQVSKPSVDLPLTRFIPGSWAGRFFGPSKRALIETLLAAGAITPSMADAARSDIWRSHDGTVSLDMAAARLNVVTRLTSASAGAETDIPISLGRVQLLSSDAPGLIAASALDGTSLTDSRRILLMMVSDARNSGMEFADAESRVVKNGALPVIVRRMKAKVRIQVPRKSRWEFKPLFLNGDEMKGVIIQANGQQLIADLDTRTVNGEPTTYFLLTRM